MSKTIFDLSKTSPNPKTFEVWPFPFHISYRMLATDFKGILFIIYAAVSREYPQNDIEKSMKHIMDHTISNRMRFLLSDTPSMVY